MQLKKLFDDDSAVSPVIGVILMVAITVILAAVIATFVLGLGEQVQDTAPSASFTFELDEGVGASEPDDWDNSGVSSDDAMLEVRHSGGPTIDAETLSLGGSSIHGGPAAYDASPGPYGSGSTISAGDTANIWIDTSDTIDVIWESEGESAILATYPGPDA